MRCASLLLREEADLVDRGWRELVDGEEMKLRVGVLQGLELGFLGAAAVGSAADAGGGSGDARL